MAVFGICEGCETWKPMYVSVLALVSSMGSREERRQKSTKAMKFCRMCFNSPKMPRRLLALVRETAKAVAKKPAEGSLI